MYLTTPFESLVNKSGALTNVPFKGVSGYVNVPVKSYQARVNPAGTKTVAIDSKRIPTWNSMIRTVVAIDNPGGATPFTFLFLEDRN